MQLIFKKYALLTLKKSIDILKFQKSLTQKALYFRKANL